MLICCDECDSWACQRSYLRLSLLSLLRRWFIATSRKVIHRLSFRGFQCLTRRTDAFLCIVQVKAWDWLWPFLETTRGQDYWHHHCDIWLLERFLLIFTLPFLSCLHGLVFTWFQMLFSTSLQRLLPFCSICPLLPSVRVLCSLFLSTFQQNVVDSLKVVTDDSSTKIPM